MNDKLIALGTQIIILRTARGWTPTELARRANISKSSLSMIEQGQQNPGITTVIAIADALGAYPSDLFPPKNPPKGLYDKYAVYKNNGEPIDPEAAYFVLRVDHDPASFTALYAYALVIQERNPELALDLLRLISEIWGDSDPENDTARRISDFLFELEEEARAAQKAV